MPKEDTFVNRAQLLTAIKKYPEIWDSNNKLYMCRSVTAPMWNEISKQFRGHVPPVKLQSIWSRMKYYYHNLVHRQILHRERFTTKWEHFEPMSFMYNITVSKIIGANQTVPNNNQTTIVPLDMVAELTATPSTFATSTPSTFATSTPIRGRRRSKCNWVPVTNNNEDGTKLMDSIEFMPFKDYIGNANDSINNAILKPTRPGTFNNSMRGRIIEVIRMYPAIWGSKQRGQRRPSQNRSSKVWKDIANQLDLTPSLVQSRWAIIKQRYVDELQKERHATYMRKSFNSTWEHFERMSFMRDILNKKVDEREQTREHIQEIVNEQHQQQQQQQQLQLQHHHEQQPELLLQQHNQHHHHHQHQHQHNTTEQPFNRVDVICGNIHTTPLLSGIEVHCGATTNTTTSTTTTTATNTNGDDINIIELTAQTPLQICNNNNNNNNNNHLQQHQLLQRRTTLRSNTIKTETDLEWNPFEMILSMHDTSPSPKNN